MYGESEYHGAYAAGQSEVGSGMHKSPSGSKCCLNCGSHCLSAQFGWHARCIWESNDLEQALQLLLHKG